MPTRYNVTENRDGMGFSNGLSLDDGGDYVSYSDYEKLKRAYDALAEDITAAQGQIADAQAALELAPAPSWQPISSAPKDGTEIQGWIVRREDGISGKKEYWEPRIRWVGVWEYMHPHGWCELSMLSWVTKFPTHWMPLPAPPTAAA